MDLKNDQTILFEPHDGVDPIVCWVWFADLELVVLRNEIEDGKIVHEICSVRGDGEVIDPEGHVVKLFEFKGRRRHEDDYELNELNEKTSPGTGLSSFNSFNSSPDGRPGKNSGGRPQELCLPLDLPEGHA